MKNSRGNYKDIANSQYAITVGDHTFYFTSLTGQYRFIRKISTNLTTLELIEAYQRSEKRGFRIHCKGVDHRCLETLLSASVKKM